jgi:hypothetical protein
MPRMTQKLFRRFVYLLTFTIAITMGIYGLEFAQTDNELLIEFGALLFVISGISILLLIVIGVNYLLNVILDFYFSLPKD